MHRFRTLLTIALLACLVLPAAYAQEGDEVDVKKDIKIKLGDKVLELEKLMSEIKSDLMDCPRCLSPMPSSDCGSSINWNLVALSTTSQRSCVSGGRWTSPH